LGFCERSPHPALARFVEALCASDDADRPAPRAPVRVVPDGCCELLLSANATSCTGALYGTRTRALLVASDTPVENVSVRLRSGAAARFFALRGDEIGDGVLELRALWGGAGAELVERVGEARSVEARFAALERELLPRLARGAAPIPRVAESVGLGERRLERAFRARIGVSPKRLARILRFRAAYAALARGAPELDVALGCGYADQSHLLRDFCDFAGGSPRQVLARPASESSNTGATRSVNLGSRPEDIG
jgi:AraC-like DNA-binding protein